MKPPISREALVEKALDLGAAAMRRAADKISIAPHPDAAFGIVGPPHRGRFESRARGR